ncbi:hypothetical protein [Mycoplasma sp. P36-A1]|uniref:hypothetical protein n=1 Tax=Mycoplasma sp. P36-A1 TaxID=3252900 RepID=UPI003C2BE198
MKFSFVIKSIREDFKNSSKFLSWVSIMLLILFIILIILRINIIPNSPEFKNAGLTVISILFSFQLFLFQSTNFDNLKVGLSENGVMQLKKYQTTLVTNFRVILLYIFISIFLFEYNIIINVLILVTLIRLLLLMLYSTVLFNISTLKKVYTIPQHHISDLDSINNKEKNNSKWIIFKNKIWEKDVSNLYDTTKVDIVKK